MDFLDILKLVLLVIGIIAVGAFIVWGLVSLILKIIEPHGSAEVKQNDYANNQITYEKYEPIKLVENTKEVESVEVAKETADEVKDVDLDMAKQEEEALSGASPFSDLEAEEEEFIKAKQKNIEERLAAKEDDVNVDDIFVDDELDEDEDDEDEDDIESLINKILDGENDEDDEGDGEEKSDVQETVEENAEEEVEATEEAEEVEETEAQEPETEEAEDATEEDVAEIEVQGVESETKEDDVDARVRELEEQLARQKEEYENKIKALEEEKSEDNVAPAGSIEEYEARLEVLKDRLKANEKDLKTVKKDFIPLYKINKTLERDNVKLRRKEALVAKQKVVLYGVNNYVDIDEEKAKKLSEDLDLLEGLRLSVQHCEEVMKANEDRYPILEKSYNSLLETNKNIKADIEECNAKIEEIKAAEEEGNND